MRRAMLPAAALSAALALSACGSAEKKTVVVADNGETVTIGTKTGSDGVTRVETTNDKGEKVSADIGGRTWPVGAPAYATAYPGAIIASVIAATSDGKASNVVIFESSDAPAKIIDHYKALAATAGLGQVSSVAAGATNVFSASDEKSGRQIVVQASSADGKTSATLSFGNGG